MVASLIASGASAGAVTDQSAQDPIDKTAASIAANSGHKGLAGYLSEAHVRGYQVKKHYKYCWNPFVCATEKRSKCPGMTLMPMSMNLNSTGGAISATKTY
ncbi:calmodulin-binding transcription activator 1-like [Gastrolobium bilobum]|uniref:calmodulin-binding transcription activator 1-like n=1 Tax=Gastrolobium bilobum TaxID=150636 RepID=UPI002AB312B8|nr:calmodulin-binding transcription activator 1-like [Gastrolobium bilobum]